MLQPFQTVLPQVAENPYNINVATPNVSPIEIEQRLTQVNAMKQAADIQRQQMAIQQQQMLINAEMQKQRIRQADEIHRFQVQKFEEDQRQKVRDFGESVYKDVEKITGMPRLSQADHEFFSRKYREYGLSDGEGGDIGQGFYDLLSSGDRIEIEGAQNKLRKFVNDPEVREYFQKAEALGWFTKNYDPKKHDANVLNQLNELGDRVGPDGEPIRGSGISGLSMNTFTPNNLLKKTNPTVHIMERLVGFTKGGMFPTEENFEEMSSLILDSLDKEGVQVTPEIKATVEAMLSSKMVTNAKVAEDVKTIAENFMGYDASGVLDIARTLGPVEYNKVYLTTLKEASKHVKTEKDNQTKINVARTKVSGKSGNTKSVIEVAFPGNSADMVDNRLVANHLLESVPNISFDSELFSDIKNFNKEYPNTSAATILNMIALKRSPKKLKALIGANFKNLVTGSTILTSVDINNLGNIKIKAQTGTNILGQPKYSTKKKTLHEIADGYGGEYYKSYFGGKPGGAPKPTTGGGSPWQNSADSLQIIIRD